MIFTFAAKLDRILFDSATMSDLIKIKRGIDIKLVGQAEQIYASVEQSDTFAIKPEDFKGVKSKLLVKEGDEVKAGTPILFNKDKEAVKICSPVSGEVTGIIRGDKRKLLEVVILADKEFKYIDFGSADPNSLGADEIREKLLASGCWPLIKQRPYNVVANPGVTPKSIFISCFDTSPLSPDMDFVVHGMDKEFQAGVDALSKLTDGGIHLGVDGRTNPSKVFTNCKGVKITRFKGPHPAGNVGVQIHSLSPINKGEIVWTLSPQDVIIVGKLFLKGKFDASINISISGSEITKPRYYKTFIGASVKSFLKDNVSDNGNRYISGNILTGTRIKEDGYLGYFDREIAAIPEGDKEEFFGWITPGGDKFSISRTLVSWMMPNKKHTLDSSMHGEERAFVVSGEYEKVFPFDIFPVQLLKAIMVRDIEAMENLGIYEVVEEDLALCEVVCTSKIPVQQTVREGLDLMFQELGD